MKDNKHLDAGKGAGHLPSVFSANKPEAFSPCAFLPLSGCLGSLGTGHFLGLLCSKSSEGFSPESVVFDVKRAHLPLCLNYS